MIEQLFILFASLFLVIKCSLYATRYAVRLAESYRLSKYIVGFIVVAVISILPELSVVINAALEHEPALGMGTLFGSNVADLTLVFAIIILFAGRGIQVHSDILKNNIVFPFLLLIPVILGLDGQFSRIDGAVLILVGSIFYYTAFRNDIVETGEFRPQNGHLKNFSELALSLVGLLVSSHFVVSSSIKLAHAVGINPVLIGTLFVGLGTTIPELSFSLKAVKKHHDSLAVGDLLGTVLADATVVIGLLAVVSPFSFAQKTLLLPGGFMVFSAFLLFYLMHTGYVLSKKEGVLLFLVWILFAVSSVWMNL